VAPFDAASRADFLMQALARGVPAPLLPAALAELPARWWRAVETFAHWTPTQLAAHRLALVRRVRAAAADSQPAYTAWRASLPESVRRVAGHINVPLLRLLAAWAGAPDVEVLDQITAGMVVAGEVQASLITPTR